jgi:hypothetical protein
LAKLSWINNFDRVIAISRNGMNHEGDIGYVTKINRKLDIVTCYMYNTGEEVEYKSSDLNLFLKARR